MLPLATVDFTIAEDGSLLATTADDEPDVVISLPPEAPFLALQGGERLAQAVRISGAADLADTLGFVLRKLRWDIEEDLSQVIGDIAAHRVAGMIDALAAWQKQAALNLAENITEYLTEERPVLAGATDIAAFAEQVGRLRSDLARIEQRIRQLHQSAG